MPAHSKSGHVPQACKNIPQASCEFLHTSEVQKAYLAKIHCIWGIRTKMKTWQVKHHPNSCNHLTSLCIFGARLSILAFFGWKWHISGYCSVAASRYLRTSASTGFSVSSGRVGGSRVCFLSLLYDFKDLPGRPF